MKAQGLGAFEIYRGATYYNSFKKVVFDLDFGLRAYQFASMAGPPSHFTHQVEIRPKEEIKTANLLTLPDAKVRNVDCKISCWKTNFLT